MKNRYAEPNKRYGMNWITQHKRLAIYLRDGLACAYCGHSVEQGAPLTLDHVRSHIRGGSNHESNLVTACDRCNKSKNDRSLRSFAVAVSLYLNHGLTSEVIITHVRACTRRTLDITRAKELVALRGSAAKVLAAHTSI